MLITYALAYCSFLAFSLSMKKHFQQMFPQQKCLSVAHAKWMRACAWGLLSAAFIFAANRFGWATGAVIVIGLLTLTTFLHALLLNYSPRLIPFSLLLVLLLALLVSLLAA